MVLLVDFLGSTAQAKTFFKFLETLHELFHVTGGDGGHDAYTFRIQGRRLLLQQRIDPGLRDGLIHFRGGSAGRDGADRLSIYFDWQAALIGKVIRLDHNLKIAVLQLVG